MFVVTIDPEKCEGDGECVEVCPVSILEVVDGKAVVSGDMGECLGCESCVSTCPHGAITIQEY
jgi:NAD-dependent dihydropyrimidine dehydrogenase PreA subunit